MILLIYERRISSLIARSFVILRVNVWVKFILKIHNSKFIAPKSSSLLIFQKKSCRYVPEMEPGKNFFKNITVTEKNAIAILPMTRAIMCSSKKFCIGTTKIKTFTKIGKYERLKPNDE